MHRSVHDVFSYKLKNKYQCLNNPPAGEFARVRLHKQVYKCLNIQNEYEVEQCLKRYESLTSYGVCFTGKGQEWDDSYYESYGACGSGSIPSTREYTIPDIQSFMCKKLLMQFNNCPDCLEHIAMDLQCEVFDLKE